MTTFKPMHVKVRDTADVVFEGEVDRISSHNEVGEFDIFPMHANFISIIKKKLSLYLKGKLLKEIKFSQAVLKSKQDVVDIFLGIDELVVES
jgi:F0F1-type ATP synthase epsilon subunit